MGDVGGILLGFVFAGMVVVLSEGFLDFICLASRIAGGLFSDKRKWFHSCYEKLASSLVFDNEKMLKRGFKPRHSLETIFPPQITQISQRND